MVRVVNIQDAKANLSSLIDQAVKGEPFIISKAGKPLVKVVPVDQPAAAKRLGFMSGAFTVPDDFDRMGQADIEAMFGLDTHLC